MSFPTQLTVFRIILVPVFYLLFAVIDPPQVVWALVVFSVAAISDWYDGYFARRFNLISRLGGFLDPLADKLLTSAAFVAFAAKGYVPWWMVIIVIARDAYLTGFRVLSDTVGASVKTSYFAKWKTFFQMVYIACILSGFVLVQGSLGNFAIPLGTLLTSSDVIYWGMFIVTFLTGASAIQYTVDNWLVVRRIAKRYLSPHSQEL